MDNKFKSAIDSLTREYVPVLGVFIVAAFGMRLMEASLVYYQHGASVYGPGELAGALLIDLRLVILVSLPLSLISYLTNRAGTTAGVFIISVITGISAVITLLLSFYYSSTLTPLGPEFWAYSMSEMMDTVIAAERFVGLKLVAFLLLAIFFIIAAYRMVKWLSGRTFSFRMRFMVTTVVTAAFGSLILYPQSSTLAEVTSNKLSYFVTSALEQSAEPIIEYEPIEDIEYPFLRRSTQGDVLGPFFKDLSEPPNIVFILVESLGGEFVGRKGQWTGFAPFIDSLAASGLYWENGLSMSGRTFGMIPSLIGSLPPGKNGFMDFGPDYPSHTSIIRMLDQQGYTTSFYSGYNTYFDGLNYFLDYQGTDVIMNKEWISTQFESLYETESNYWGYDDKTMFEIASAVADTATDEPRLEIYHTLQTHSPFTVPHEREYAQRFNERLETLNLSSSDTERFQRYRSELTTLLFTDDALRDFMEEYKKRARYSNTLFIITGDHWLIPVPQTSRISRYHVPIIFYSELIKEPVRFESVNTHANITPALTTFLKKSTNLSLPDSVHWIGDTMDTTRTFQNIHSLPLMQNKNQMSDHITGQYFLNNGTLYQLNEGLNLTQISNPEIENKLEQALASFKSKSIYVTENDKLYPKVFKGSPTQDYKFITQFADLFRELDSDGLSVDEQFSVAREYAFAGNYEKSRAIAKRLLLNVPDYHDIRIMLARTHAWNQEYEKARDYLYEVQRRDSTYYDTYNALADTEYWAGNYSEALRVINTGLSFHSKNESFLQKKIKILIALDRDDEAKLAFSELKDAYPSHEDLNEFEAQLF